IRGGLVLEFHVPLAIPFLALNFGLGALDLISGVRLPVVAARPALACGVALVLCWSASGLANLYLDRPGAAGREAVAWIERSVPPGAVIVGRDDMWVDLLDTDGATSLEDFFTVCRHSYLVAARLDALTVRTVYACYDV